MATNTHTSARNIGFVPLVRRPEAYNPVTANKPTKRIMIMIAQASCLFLLAKNIIRRSPGIENSILSVLELRKEKNCARDALDWAPTACHAAIASLTKNATRTQGDRDSSYLIDISRNLTRLW